MINRTIMVLPVDMRGSHTVTGCELLAVVGFMLVILLVLWFYSNYIE